MPPVVLPRSLAHPERFVNAPGIKQLLDIIQQKYGSYVQNSGTTDHALRQLGGGYSMTDGPLVWAALRWNQNNRPIYFLDKELAETLTHTQIPMQTFTLPIWIPDDGMFLVLPPIFTLENQDTGHHVVEGIYLVKDTVAVRVGPGGEERRYPGEGKATAVDLVSRRDTGFVPRPAIQCVGVGKSKTANPNDDAIIHISITQGTPLQGDSSSTFGGVPELLRVVCNLLYALQNTSSVARRIVVPQLSRKQAKRKPGKLLASGRTDTPYTVLYLSGPLRTAAPPSAQSAGPTSPGQKLLQAKRISGHFHRYWVLDPGTDKVLATKPGATGTLYLVEYLLAPYVQGGHLPPPPTTVLVKPNPSRSPRPPRRPRVADWHSGD